MDRGFELGKWVIATFIVDWPVLLLLGVAFGSAAPRARWWRSRAFVWGVSSTVAFAAIALVAYALAPDWMWMYYIDPDEAGWSVPFIAAGYIVVFAIAFAATVAFGDLGRRWSWILATAAVALEGVTLGLTWDRYRLVGSAAEWRSGRGDELITVAPSGTARVIGLLGAAFAVAVVVQLYLLRRGPRAAVAGR